jgi:hypothetical protein
MRGENLCERQRQRRVTDGNFFIAQIMFLYNKKNSFFPSLNQYFPHIP